MNYLADLESSVEFQAASCCLIPHHTVWHEPAVYTKSITQFMCLFTLAIMLAGRDMFCRPRTSRICWVHEVFQLCSTVLLKAFHCRLLSFGRKQFIFHSSMINFYRHVFAEMDQTPLMHQFETDRPIIMGKHAMTHLFLLNKVALLTSLVSFYLSN